MRARPFAYITFKPYRATSYNDPPYAAMRNIWQIWHLTYRWNLHVPNCMFYSHRVGRAPAHFDRIPGWAFYAH